MKLFVNDLTVIDSSFVDTTRGIVGESWIVDLQLTGGLNEESMVLDFGVVKKQIKALIDDLADHRLIVPTQAPELALHRDVDATWVSNSATRQGSFFVQGPEQAFCFIEAPRIDEQSVAQYLERMILPQLPSNVKAMSLSLRSEAIDEPYYHYSHGLKKHSGNCQRIAHGHRSRIRIYKDGQLDPQLQALWAERWEDIYLITEEDIVELDTLSEGVQGLPAEDLICASYQSPQGHFEIALPRERSEVMTTDSTVERIAEYIAEQVAQMQPGHAIEVYAYEGVSKGAIAESRV
ncbi:6-carboxytetrahydropterin synthase [Ferrimonas marina]|uniref:6-pyruvoyl-tetrahydropterin synthase n=1 Tax=Ferrimonas marina TaxID=299255 RepID=A0A1M5RJF1_9GAMM|nr:6-carboxytetrahydropterin synthase [Ferrimonas marina]SHH26219.1 6-pyruvoyl-tetrahydropterin synthase [Ferrimonas marina]